ncbi:MAG: serine hydrolase [Verrucomicrobia bacterium]|nr:serine hydrolase [Verrucomicrobiota bacterium]
MDRNLRNSTAHRIGHRALLCLVSLWPLEPGLDTQNAAAPKEAPFFVEVEETAIAASAAENSGPRWDWTVASPESQGMSSAKLEAIKDRLAAKKTRAFLVVRNDRIVHEWYAPGQSAMSRHGTASLAKALVAGMSLAVAMQDGKIALDDAASKFVPQWRTDPRKSKITIRHLGSHTSGLSDSTTEGVRHEDQPGWMGDFWKRLDPPRDPFTIARDETPLLFEPGEKLQYSNPGIGMLTYCVAAALDESSPRDICTLLRDRVFRPIGIADAEWSAGYGKTFRVEGLPLVGAWGGAAFTARATARVGRLVLHHGNWNGRQILSKDVVRQVTTDAGLPGNCGMGWWSNGGRRYDKLPQDAVWGAGAGDQLLLVIPSLNLIMVRNGQTLEPGSDEPPVRQDNVFTKYHDYRSRILFEPLVEAVTERASKTGAAPYPPSPVIQEIRWAPKSAIVRKAKGGDNWPMTWGDDDALYTAYGDGNGFEPFVPEKLSMGLAKVLGSPPDFKGINLRSPTVEQRGEGQAGKKASGLLMVDGVLHLWARNAGNSQLAWSSDRGATWTWSDWKFTTSFGCPTFLNFAKNYAGARDDLVYIYSPDSDSAYLAVDRMVLARVPKDRLKDRSAYKFFQAVQSDGRAVWTTDIQQRGTVFTHPGKCYRSGITYNSALKRYLWCQTLPQSKHPQGPRFQGGFGIYDAPEPWGPWTTVYFTDEWDMGPGETSSFPTKWMSADGKTLHLVFSGDDCFSVRVATLTLRDAAP